MSTLKTSISILALATGLAIGFAPQASFAQEPPNAGAATAVQNMVDHLNKIKEAEKKLQTPQKPPATNGTPSNGGASGNGTGTGATKGSSGDGPVTGFSKDPSPPSSE